MTSHAVAEQLQQRPSAREGGLFKREWFDFVVRFVEESMVQICRALGFGSTPEGATAGDPDYTVGVMMAIDPNTRGIYIMDVIRGRWSPAETMQAIKTAAMCDGYRCTVRLPQDPGGAGRFQAHYLAGLLQGYDIRVEREEGSKSYRANPFAAQREQGSVALMAGTWNEAFVEEICAFPNGAHDDQVDAPAAAFRALVRRPHWHLAGA